MSQASSIRRAAKMGTSSSMRIIWGRVSQP
jgi:hypothetical protein